MVSSVVCNRGVRDFVLGIALLMLAGCGGGGGSSAASPTATPSEAPATRTPTSVPTVTLVPTHTPSPEPTATLVPTSTPVTPDDTPTPEPTATPEPTEVPTPTPLTGPVVVAFGVAEGGGAFSQATGTDEQGRSIFARQSGSGFILYVEGRSGLSGLPIATNLLSTLHDDPIGQPDLQIVSSRSLGNGSASVCDRAYPNVGGVPATDPPDFSFVQPVSDALNDFACRFRVFPETDFACTQDNNGYLVFSNRGADLQFCTLIGDSMKFPPGDTLLTVRLRDSAGRAGVSAQIVVRVAE